MLFKKLISHNISGKTFSVLPFLVLFIPIILSQFSSYLLFHTTVEIVGIVVAGGIFMLSWNTRKINTNDYFFFLGIMYFSVGIIDFAHTLSYKGMNIFSGIDSNVPTQLWIGSRYLLAGSMLIAPLLIGRKINGLFVFVTYIVIAGLLMSSVFYWKNFPVGYSEYIVSGLFLISAFLLIFFRKKFDRKIFVFILLSLIANIFAGLLFALYVGVHNFSNILGHLAKLLSYYLIYKAIIEVGLTKPYRLLFLESKEAERQKDEFISIASHELKTPITTIKSYAQILSRYYKGKKNGKLLTYVSRLEFQVDRLTVLVNELLDVSKIQYGKLEVVRDKFDMAELIKDVAQDMQQSTKTHKIIVETTGKIAVVADKHYISQCLANLISNAIKFSPKADKVIIKTFCDRRNIRVSVQDFGIGIKKKDLSRVFGRFFQADNRIRNSSGGLGLGLYLSKKIINRHHGEIWGESEKGEGSIFTFKIPLQSSSL